MRKGAGGGGAAGVLISQTGSGWIRVGLSICVDYVVLLLKKVLKLENSSRAGNAPPASPLPSPAVLLSLKLGVLIPSRVLRVRVLFATSFVVGALLRLLFLLRSHVVILTDICSGL